MKFVLVDRILTLDPGRSIIASKTMSEAEELFRDHFPGFPVIPGVLLTEMMAQAGGKCLFAGDPGRGFPVLLRIKDATFRSWARPGDEIHLHGEVMSNATDYASVRCHAKVGGKRICRADLSYGFLPPRTFANTPDIFLTESLE